MSIETIRLRAAIDQAKAALRERVSHASAAVGAHDRRAADSVIHQYFGPIMRDVVAGEDLTGQFNEEFVEFLLAAGAVAWGDYECQRVEAEEADE